jgi:hypothetical protein
MSYTLHLLLSAMILSLILSVLYIWLAGRIFVSFQLCEVLVVSS